MSWWNWFKSDQAAAPMSPRLLAVRLTMPGWTEKTSDEQMRTWFDSQSNLVSLAILETSPALPLSNQVKLQQAVRKIAESREAGLIEVSVVKGVGSEAVSWIYKRLQKPAYIFTGMLWVSRPDGDLLWTIVAGERGTTGIREAVVTAELLDAGELTIENYEHSWAQDPYQPAYRGVDQSVLRFISDDECYDKRFPDHPLSTVRKILATLPDSMHIESGPQEGG